MPGLEQADATPAAGGSDRHDPATASADERPTFAYQRPLTVSKAERWGVRP